MMSYQGNHRNLDGMMKQGVKSIGNRMRDDLNEELGQAKDDFDTDANKEIEAE